MHTTHHAVHDLHPQRLRVHPGLARFGGPVAGWLRSMKRAWNRQNRREARLLDLYWRSPRKGGPFPPWGMFPGA